MPEEARREGDNRRTDAGRTDAQPREPSDEVLCAVRGCWFHSEGGATLRDVNVSVAKGRTTLVIGPSGCGKSLLLKVMAGLLPAAAGRAVLFGKDLARVSDREERRVQRRTGFVFQDAALWQNMSVHQNLSLPVSYHLPGAKQAVIEEQLHPLIRRFGLEEYLESRPAQLAMGVRKLVSFARALVLDPELLFVDEATAFLDREAANKITGYLRDFKNAGKTIVAATHDARVAALLADDLIVMHRGEVLESGPMGLVSRSERPMVQTILTDVLSETATYTGDILELLGSEEEDALE